jgi:hypothetical protein
MAKGVKHYLPNGKEYKGATHKKNQGQKQPNAANRFAQEWAACQAQ